MLASQYRYIALDFETTGLDLQNDEPIQIGIAELSPEGKIIGGYQSLLRPSKPQKQLKSIVGFITGLAVEQLESAPTPEEILADLQPFFDERMIIIGHNINFDLAFLRKFFPKLTRKTEIDTFKLSQDLMHYVPSYAQEILIQQLQSKPDFQLLLQQFWLQWELAFHDAFFDAKLSLALFSFLIQRIEKLMQDYPILSLLLQKSQSPLKLLFPQPQSLPKLLPTDTLPPLKKIAPAQTQLKTSPYDLAFLDTQATASFHIQNLHFKDLLASLAKRKKIILSFSTKPKLDIAKNLLNDLGIKNLWFAKEEQTLSSQSLAKFVQKEQFSASEFSFLLKYVSHLEQGLGVLDLNSKENYEIYTALKDQRPSLNYPIILTTHGGLFSLLEQGESYQGYEIYFFDASWRYKSFNFYLSRPYDLNYTLNYLDMLCYKYQLLHSYGEISEKEKSLIEAFRQFFTMFLGILGQETKKFFIHTEATQLTLEPIIGNIAFFQTNKLLSRFVDFEPQLRDLLTNGEFQTLRKQIEHMHKIFESMLTVEKKMYERSAFSFIYAEEVKFTERNDFKSLFAGFKTFFLSNLANEYPALLPQIQPAEQADTVQNKIFHLSKIPSIIKALQTPEENQNPNDLIFILSVKKEESKALFEEMIAKGLEQDYLLLVENITWGSGKNLFKAKQQGKKVVIWGYNFLLQLFAQKLAISRLFVYNSKGKEQNLIFNDILRYGRQNLL